jgi:cell wall-active antibiotic response 4TMS protein YvqF
MDIPVLPREVRMSWSGVILVVVGVLLLANNFGLLPLGWLRQWWPAILIAVGLMSIVRPQRGRRRASDDVADPTRRDVDPRP